MAQRDLLMTNRFILTAAVLAAGSILQGCASAPQRAEAAPGDAGSTGGTTSRLCASPACAPEIRRVAHATEVPVEPNAPDVDGHPLTSVVVTQCNLIVAVYMTMPDGKLLRFDHNASVTADQLLAMAYTATRSERVEVSCNDDGVAGYETHEPT